MVNIKEIPIGDIKPYENNPRINGNAVEYVENSIKEFGFKVPIVVDRHNVVVAGHTRLIAAQNLGLTKIPCIIADDLTPEQVMAYRIADNRTHEFSKWDIDLLKEELQQLQEMDFDISLTGFDEDIFDEIEPLDIEDTKESSEKKQICHCPKCGFEFEVEL